MLSLRAALSIICSSFPCRLLNTVFATWSRAKPSSPWHPPQQRQWRYGDLTLSGVTQGNFQNQTLTQSAPREAWLTTSSPPSNLRPLNFTRRTQRRDSQLQPLPVRSGFCRRDRLRQPLREGSRSPARPLSSLRGGPREEATRTDRPPGAASAGTPGAAPLSLQSRPPGRPRADSPEPEPRRWEPARAPRCCTPGPPPPRAPPAGARDLRAAPTPPPCGPRHSGGDRHGRPDTACCHVGRCGGQSEQPQKRRCRLGIVVRSPGAVGAPWGARRLRSSRPTPGQGSSCRAGAPRTTVARVKPAPTALSSVCPCPCPSRMHVCSQGLQAVRVLSGPGCGTCWLKGYRSGYSNKSPQCQAEDWKACYQQ